MKTSSLPTSGTEPALAVRQRFRRRRLLVAGLLVTLVAGAAGFWMVQSRLRDAGLRGLLDAAKVSGDRGDYEEAVQNLEQYLRRFPQDVPVLTNYAEVRAQVPLPGGKHLLAALDARQRLSRLIPADRANKLAELKLYDRLDMSSEAMNLAQDLLDAEPDSTEVLLTRARHQARTRRGTEARETLDRLLTVDPLYLRGHELVLRLMLERNESETLFERYAERLLAEHPEATDARVIAALAYSMVGDAPAAGVLADQAAGDLAGNPERLRLLSAAYDQVGAYAKATDLSEEALRDPRLASEAAAAIRRLWEARRYEVLAEMDSQGKGVDRATATTEHLLAMARFSIRGPKAIEAFVETDADTSAGVDKSYGAVWKELLLLVTGQEKVSQDQLQDLHEAVRSFPGDPQLSFFVGELLLRNGAHEPAIRLMARASRLSPAWTAPYTTLSRTLRLTGREGLSLAPAHTALQLEPKNPAVVQNFLEAASVSLERFNDGQLVLLRDAYDAMDAERQQAALAPLDVALAAAQSVDRGRAVLDRWLPRTADFSPSTLWSLLSVVQRSGLERELVLVEAAAEQRGVDPLVAGLWARVVAVRESTDAGWELFKRERPSGDSGASFAWAQAQAVLADQLGRSDAAAQWKAVLDDFPERADTLRRALQSTSVWRDTDLRDAAIQTLADLASEDDYAVRWARARSAVQAADGQRALTDSVEQLTALAADFPWLFEPQVLLAESQAKLANWTLAAQFFGRAYKLAPDRWNLRLEQARMLERAGQAPVAASILRAEQADESLSDARRAAYAAQWIAWGENAQAKRLVDAAGDHVDPRTELGRLRVVLDAASGNRADAVAGARGMLEEGDPERWRVAVNVLGRLGDREGLEAALSGLEGLDLVGARASLYRGVVLSYLNASEAAGAAFSEAVADPRWGPAALRQWVQLGLRAGDPAVLTGALDLAGGHASQTPWENDAAVAAMVARRDALRGRRLSPVVRVLLTETLQSGLDPQVAWNTIEAGWAATEDPELWSAVVIDTRRAVDQHAGSSGLRQMLVSASHAEGNTRGAAAAADEAARTFPQDLMLRQLQMAVYLELRDWPRVAELARSLSELSPRARALGLLTESEAWAQLNDGEAALKALETLAQEGQIDLAADPLLRSAWMRARLLRGEAPDALSEAVDLQAVGAEELAGLINTLALTRAETGAAAAWAGWFDERLSGAADTDPAVRMAIARWWRLVHESSHDDAHGERAVPLLASLVDDPQWGGVALLMEGQLFELLGRDSQAEASYRAVLARELNTFVVQNNLAMVLSRLGVYDEAESLVRAALGRAPQLAALHDTHAEVLRAAGRPAEALAAAREAVELAPKDPAIAITLGFTLLEAGELDEARAVLGGIDESAVRRANDPALAERLSRLTALLRGSASAKPVSPVSGDTF